MSTTKSETITGNKFENKTEKKPEIKSEGIILSIQDLHASINDKPILQGLNMTIRAGEVHAIMGPNGSGKTTLAQLLARKEGITATQGKVIFRDEDLFKLSIETCALKGLFLGFQYPVAIPGVSNIQFLKTIVNAKRQTEGLAPLDAVDFLNLVNVHLKKLNMPEELLYRSVNDGFSGGEKKRNEILQMLLLEPKLSVLDETDSGLDIDALKTVAEGINAARSPDRAILLITHYQRLLDYITPDFVHVLSNGKMIKSGTKELAFDLETKGYAWLQEA